MDREQRRGGILPWGQLAPGWLGEHIPAPGKLAGEDNGIPCPGAALSQPAVASWQRERGRNTQQHPTPPEHWQCVTPHHVCLSHTMVRRWQRATQLHPTLPEFLQAGHKELRLGIRKQPGWQSSKVPAPLRRLPALLAGQSPAPSLPAKAQCKERSDSCHLCSVTC